MSAKPFPPPGWVELRLCAACRGRSSYRRKFGKNTGFGRFPSRHFDVNATWLELSLTAIDRLAWARVLLLDGELAAAEPKKLRYRLLHVAARLTRGGRRLRLRISATWPWRHELATAFHRLAALPRPVD
ncbi:transposase [Streptomyces sp. NBC_01443]|nr:transposase [Streptomyces sp. NBC_01443]